MATVSEGLAVEDAGHDVNSDAGFNAALRDAAASSSEGPADDAEFWAAARAAELHAPGEVVRNQLLDQIEHPEEYDASNRVRDGLTMKSPELEGAPPIPTVESITSSIESAGLTGRVIEQLDAAKLDDSELAAFRQSRADSVAVRAFGESLFDPFASQEEAARLWSQISPEVRREVVENGSLEPEVAAHLESTAETIDRVLSENMAREDAQRAHEANQAAWSNGIQEATNGWGTRAQKEERLHAANALAEAHGIDLDQVAARDPQAGLAYLASFDAVARESQRVRATAAFHQSVLDASTSDVRDGFERLTNSGEWKPINDSKIAPQPLDLTRVGQNARQAVRVTPEEAQENLARVLLDRGGPGEWKGDTYEANSISDAFRVGTEAEKRHARQQEEKMAHAWSGFTR